MSEPTATGGGDPVYSTKDVLAALATIAWIVATVVAFVQWSRTSGGEQSPIEALVVMAPWVIAALGLTSVRRFLD